MSAPSPDRITEDELLERTGFAREHVRRLAELGLLDRDGGNTYPRREVVRARAVADLEALGIPPEGIAHAIESGHLSFAYLEVGGRRFPRADRTFAQVADDLGIAFETLERIYVAYGLARPTPDEHIREEDLIEIRKLGVLREAGVDEAAMLRLARVNGDAARRVAQYLIHTFHADMEEPYRRRGMDDNRAFEAAIREVGLRIGRGGEDMLGWLFRRHSDTFMREHRLEHAEGALEAAGVHERSERMPGAAAFADVSGYTTLTEEQGDDAAARVALTLADLVSDVAERHAGTVVKMLGDGVHFHFADPGDAVLASLDIVDGMRLRGLPPAHVGIEAGPMIYDEGDYFGRTVNLAARIASAAGPDQVFVGEALVLGGMPDGVRAVEAGTFELKGIARPVRVHQAVRHGD